MTEKEISAINDAIATAAVIAYTLSSGNPATIDARIIKKQIQDSVNMMNDANIPATIINKFRHTLGLFKTMQGIE
jgi:hypothetical protein